MVAEPTGRINLEVGEFRAKVEGFRATGVYYRKSEVAKGKWGGFTARLGWVEETLGVLGWKRI